MTNTTTTSNLLNSINPTLIGNFLTLTRIISTNLLKVGLEKNRVNPNTGDDTVARAVASDITGLTMALAESLLTKMPHILSNPMAFETQIAKAIDDNTTPLVRTW